MAEVTAAASVSGRGAGLYARLSGMMFLQFAVWGAWAVMIARHMADLGFTEMQIALVFGTTAFGTIISPLFVGWIADRFMSSQKFTAICHFLGSLLLLHAWRQTDFRGMWWAIFLYSILYFPTIALTNAIAFYHMGDSERFGNIRVWGTLGWIAVQWGLVGYLLYWERVTPDVPHAGDCLLIAAGASLLMALYSLTLPDTPPTREAKNPYAFLEALRLMADRNFAVLLIISFIVAIELPFYYNLTILFLTSAPPHGVGLAPSAAQFAMTMGQVGEVVLMLLLWPSLRYLGMRWTILLGILAWPVRYAIFAVGHPAWLVIAAQTLHGICYSFFFVGGMIAVERMSPKDVRASAQALLVFATNGVGMLVGHIVSGKVHGYFQIADGVYNWTGVFSVPIAVTVLAAIAFGLLFSEKGFRERAREIDSLGQLAQALADDVPESVP